MLMKKKYTIFHNPRCSKSRRALEILNNLNLDGFVNNFFSLSEVEKAFKKAEKYQSIKTSIKPNM